MYNTCRSHFFCGAAAEHELKTSDGQVRKRNQNSRRQEGFEKKQNEAKDRRIVGNGYLFQWLSHGSFSPPRVSREIPPSVGLSF